MNLYPELAEKIVKEVRQIISDDIIVVDINGYIMASTQLNRIGSFHEGAQRVLRSKQKLIIDQELAKVLKGVREGINMPIMFEGRVIGVIGVTGNPKQVEPIAELIRRMTELIIQESCHTEQMEWKTRGVESYFFEWVNLTTVDSEFLNRGVLLNIPVHKPHICCLLQFDMSNTNDMESHWMQRDILDLFQKIFSNNNDFIIMWGPGLYLLLKNYNNGYNRSSFVYQLEEFKKNFEYRYKTPLSIGVGKTPGTHVINRSYTEAKKALKVSVKKNKLIFYEDLVIDVILEEVSQEMRDEFLENTMRKLLHHSELVDTLQCYIKNNQSIKKTALEMHLHINTLHYRLKQIKEITSIDPKETAGIVLFYLSITFLQDISKEKNKKEEAYIL
ncbi:CdaR family transcriptional regulator [Bacillus massiliigorillae]|uniref:CdaR family transcriptional regulator n=1 Tax=Bacillus massiliigorillae TaxID=1243664 RepID=UPI0005A9B789|nr:sugar diacid recognition domain-containing protein [Bacillus massiliigorillae]